MRLARGCRTNSFLFKVMVIASVIHSGVFLDVSTFFTKIVGFASR